MVEVDEDKNIDKESLKYAITSGLNSCLWTGAEAFHFTGTAEIMRGIKERNEESSFEHTAKIVMDDINRLLESK